MVNEIDTYPTPEHGWVCYHCGEHFPGTFAGQRRARDHFGWKPNTVAACQIASGDLRRLRAAEHERDNLTAEIARLKSELEEARRGRCEHCGAKINSYPQGCPLCGAPNCCESCCRRSCAEDATETAERERDEARAAAGAMREALCEAIYGLLTATLFGEAGPGLNDAREKAIETLVLIKRKPDIGAEVMRVVRAAREAEPEIIIYSPGEGAGSANPASWECVMCHATWETQRNEPDAHASGCPIGELAGALAALPQSKEDGNG